MDSEFERMPCSKMTIFHARHDIERTIDSQRNYWQLEFISQCKCTFLKLTHVSGEATRTFREYHNTAIAMLQGFACFVVGGFHMTRTALIYKDLVRLSAGIAHKRNAAQLIFHHPFEITTEEAIDEENVESTLMVGNKNIRLVGFQVLTSLYSDGQQEYAGNDFCPPTTGVIAPIVTIA